MRFYSTEYFNWLLLCVPMIVVAVFMFRRSKKILTKIFNAKLSQFLTRTYSPVKARFKVLLDILVIAFLVLCLARPQSGTTKEKQKSEGIEMIFVVDVSPSMTVDDVKPSRLDYVKIEINKLIDKLQGSKIGLVALSGSSSLICPMTPDPGAVKMYIEGLNVDSISTRGTDFKTAFEEVSKAFKEGGTGADDESQASGAEKVVVLFSDGENHEDGAKEAVETLTKQGLKLFTVTVGTEKGGTIPQTDETNQLTDFKKDRSGQVVISTARPQLMQELAQVGKGISYNFSPGSNEPDRLISDLDKLEKGEFDSREVTQYEEKYQMLLIFCILLAFLNLIFGNRTEKQLNLRPTI